MPQRCSRCAQVCPDEALYCWFDGAVLDGPGPAAATVSVGAAPFPFPFVFISGRPCRNFDELILACEAEWDEAWELLRDGSLEGFLDGVGRPDLAAVARRCAAESDPNVGLDRLLRQLPGDARMQPRLGVRPQDFNLGQVLPGMDRRFDLCLKNEGMGLLTGWVTCGGADWLAVGDEAAVAQKVFQCHDEVRLTVRVVGDRLRAGPQPEGRLFIGSTGGPACVAIRLETPVIPFTEGELAGSYSPKELAAKAKAAPQQAAPCFESGAVAAWYKANGWTYPVEGPPASGVAAVQQFFEALGLSAPPRVEIDRQTIELAGPPGAALEAVLALEAIDPRPAFAHAQSFAPWLSAGPAVLDGRTARVPLRVAAVPDQPGERLTAEVHVTANGGQHFIVEVFLAVGERQADPIGDPANLWTDAPVALELLQVALPDATAPTPLLPPTPEPIPAPTPSYPVPAPAAPAPAVPGRWMWAVAGGLLMLAVAAVGATIALVLPGEGASGPAADPPAPDPPAAVAWEDAPPGPAFVGHTSPVLAAASVTDGHLLTASGGVELRDGRAVLAADNAVHRWDGGGREIERLRGFPGGVAAAAFSRDGRYAAVASFTDHAVHLWDLHEAREVQALTGYMATIRCLAFAPDGSRVASGGADGTILAWEVDTGEPLPPLKGHVGAVNCVAIAPDGRYALSGGADHTVRLWDLQRGRLVRACNDHTDIVRATAFSPDGKQAISAGGGARDFDVRLWDVDSGAVVRRFTGHTKAVGVAVFSPDGGRVLTAGDDGAVFLWRTADGKQLRHFEGHKGAVRCAAFAAGGRRAVTGGDDAALKAWDLPAPTSELLQMLAGDDPGERLRAARDLADCGPEAAPAVPLLLRGLQGGDADFRREALRTLPKIGAPTRADVGLLEERVRDATFPEGRDYALDALAALGPDARPAALAVYRVLLDRTAGAAVRCKAAKALGAIGPNSEVRAFADLYPALRDPDPAVSAAAADALTRLRPPAKEDVLELQIRLTDDDPAVRRYAVAALTALGPDARGAASRLVEMLARDSRIDLRLAALHALLTAAPDDPASVAAFTKVLDDADPAVPPEALKALTQAGVGRGALPGLIRALGHKDAAVRQAAEDALKAARLDRAGVRALGDALKTAGPAVRERLLGVLETAGPDAGEAVSGLCAVLRDGSAPLRSRVVDLLVVTGPAGKPAGAALAALLNDKDEGLRFRAALALVTVGADEAKDAIPLLVSALRVEHPDDAAATARREKAREALATIGGPAVKPLTAAAAGDFADRPGTATTEANAWARLTAVRALKEIGPAARSPEMLRVLDELEKNDPAVDVRRAAREAIETIGRPD